MNENLKTISFVGVAVVVSLVVWITRPTLPVLTSEDQLPDLLFPGFDDPLQAASLEIVQFDESTATLRPFKVAQIDNEWSIPSHHNYPADAEDQLAEVAAGLVGLKPLEIASNIPGDHKLYGVVDPDPKKLKPGDTGVGTRVEMRDKNDDPLLSLIIGKPVPDQDDLRYVRIPGRDTVYTIKLKTDKLSTKFEDWIEDDLLKLNTWDVKRVQINDYSYDALTGRLDPRSRMTLEYDDSDSKWNLIEDRTAGQKGWIDRKLADDEELNTTKLNDMKWALDDLKIVDVARKPEGLSGSLKDTGPLQLNREDVQSLANRGFYIYQNQLLSSEGEINILMKDGVQYVLRFGQIAGRTEQEADEDEEKAKKEEETTEGEEEEDEESGDEGVNRYLFVMAEFNPDAIPKPELEPLPEEKETSEGSTSDEEASSDDGDGEEAPQGEESEAEQPEGKAPEAAAPQSDETPKAESSQAETSQEATPEDASSKEAPEDASDEEASDKSDAEAGKEADKEEDQSEIEKERERIKKENQRKQDEYDEKIKEGKQRVQELNQRFADWYYIISDEVYQKIHLSRDDVIKKKEQDEDEEEDEEADEGEEKDEEAEEGKEADQAETDQQQDSTDEQPVQEGNTISDFEQLKQEGPAGGKP